MSDGISATATGGGSVQVNVNGSTISASNNTIIASGGNSGNVTVNSSGTIISSSDSGVAITMGSGSGILTLNLTAGSVTASGTFAQGLLIQPGAGSPASVYIGAGVSVSANNIHGIGLFLAGSDNATATVLGTLSASGTAGLAAFFQGTLNVGNGGTTGTLIGGVRMFNSNAVLNFNRSDTSTFAGVIDGGGTVNQIGSGTTILTGASTYTGATNVNAGTLQVDGSIASSSGVSVNAGSILAGSGVVSSTVINNGAALLPGSLGTPGNLTVQGSLAFASAALYVVQVSPTTASRVTVNGTATIGGIVLATFAAGTYRAGTYTILSATGGVTGTFSSFGFLGNVRNPRLSYDANDVFLTVDASTISPSLSANATTNQRAVAAAIDAAILAGANPGGGLTLLNLQGAPLGAALTQISGETATGSQQTTFSAMTQFLGVLLDPFVDGRGDASAPSSGATPYAEEDALAYAARRKRTASERDAYGLMTKAPLAQNYDPRWSVWTTGFGGSQTTDGNAALGSNSATSRIFGTAVGADVLLSPHTIAGFALAGGGTNFSVNGFGNGRSDLFQAGAFVKHTVGQAYISGALAYGWQDVTTDRTVTIAGVDRLHAEFNANAWSGRVEGGYRFVAPWAGGIGITPYAAGQFTTFDLPAYTEQVLSGANMFALAYGSRSVTDTRSELGVRTDKRGRFAWTHDFNPDHAIGATFQALPGASFVVNGAAQASDAALTTASVEMKWINGWSAAATFEGEFSDVTRSYAGKGVVRYAW